MVDVVVEVVAVGTHRPHVTGHLLKMFPIAQLPSVAAAVSRPAQKGAFMHSISVIDVEEDVAVTVVPVGRQVPHANGHCKAMAGEVHAPTRSV
jgi:TPP-dependent pyruvate/acetoin dehydrogenase alpha subunit